MLNELYDEDDLVAFDNMIDADYDYWKERGSKMPKEEAKVLLRSQIEMLKAEIIRKEVVLIPLEQELMHLHHRIEELEGELEGL